VLATGRRDCFYRVPFQRTSDPGRFALAGEDRTQDRQEGYVVFDGEFTLAFEYGDEMDVTVKDRFSAFVRITDKLTDATTEHDLPEKLSAS
jgi:hypothetical protein